MPPTLVFGLMLLFYDFLDTDSFGGYDSDEVDACGKVGDIELSGMVAGVYGAAVDVHDLHPKDAFTFDVELLANRIGIDADGGIGGISNANSRLIVDNDIVEGKVIIIADIMMTEGDIDGATRIGGEVDLAIVPVAVRGLGAYRRDKVGDAAACGGDIYAVVLGIIVGVDALGIP